MEKNATVGMQKMRDLFDSGSFVEIGAYLKSENRDLTSVVCGYGAVNGRLVYAFAQDTDREKGAYDLTAAKKIGVLYEMALKNGAPVIGFFDSIGAYVSDGSTALDAYGKLLACVSRASGVIPQIALIDGVCGGMFATVAAMFDLVVAVKGEAKLFVNAPFLIGKEVGTAEYTAENGLASIVAENSTDAIARVRSLIDLLPSNCEEGVTAEEISDDVNRAVAPTGLTGAALCELIADAGRFTEIGGAYAEEMVTGLLRIGGVTCGVIANDSNQNGGRLTGEGAKKAAKLISFCDSFGIPVITLIDSEGVAVSESEEPTLATSLGKLAMAYSSADVAKITAVVGRAYGAAFTLMGSRALGADMVYALPEALVSVMEPAAAVAFLWNDRITEEQTRADLIEEWKRTRASAEAAAAEGSVDDIIDPAELRARICSAVYMLMMKRSETSARRHCNLPL